MIYTENTHRISPMKKYLYSTVYMCIHTRHTLLICVAVKRIMKFYFIKSYYVNILNNFQNRTSQFFNIFILNYTNITKNCSF